MLTHTRSSLALLTLAALALGACDGLPRPTITDGRGDGPRAASAAARAPASTPQDTITLRFAWPDEVDAKVAYTLSGSAFANGKVDAFTHAFTARKITNGWEVQEKGPLEGSDFTSAELFLRGELLAPSLVDPEGAFSGVLDAAKVHEVGQSEMRARYEREGAAAFFDSGLSKTLTPAVVSRRSLSIWRSMVGHWAGKTLTRGVPVDISFSSPVGPASAAQMPLALAGTLRYVGPTRCFPKQVEPRCVALSLKATADSDLMAASVIDSITGAIPGGEENRARIEQAIKVEDASARREVTLITDPTTMLPHKVIVTQSLELMATLKLDPSSEPQRKESKLDHRVERIFTYR